jgi:heavy metal sensor kinase
MPRWPSTLRARITLWYSVLLGLPLVAFAVACYLVFAQTLEARTDRFIGDALSVFARELAAERRATSSASAAMRTTVDEVAFRDLHIAILDDAGRVVAASAPPESDPVGESRPSADVGRRVVDSLRTHDRTKPLTLTVAGDAGAYRVLSRPLFDGGARYSLSGTYALRDIEAMLAHIREMFLVAIPLLVLVAATGGQLLTKRSLAPVASMTARAAEISATNLHERLPVGGGDELVGLARVVNDLLDRLEHAFAQQRRFVADASHELRTPTAILRTEADVTLSRSHRSEDEYRASVTVMQDAARRLTRIVDDLFLLARADAGHLVVRRAPLYLEEVVDDASRAVRSVAEQRGVQVSVRSVVEAPLLGDADLLGRLLLNLLDNAIKYSPDDGMVTVDMARDDVRYVITVTDAGPGIPPEAQDRVFERFFRVDTARSRSETSATSGAGLGLAIARRVAEMHGGRLDLEESRPGRTVFRVTLPAAAAAIA